MGVDVGANLEKALYNPNNRPTPYQKPPTRFTVQSMAPSLSELVEA